MSLTPWLKANGKKIMSQSGKPVECEECPCGGDCEEKLEAKKEEMELDPDWALIAEQRTVYICPRDVSDSESESTSEIRHRNGSLIVLMKRDLTWSSPYRYAVHAVEYEHVLTGARKTYACLCSCGSYGFAELDGYGIAGVVYADSTEDCTPWDMCEVYEMEMDFIAAWWGGELYGEGFLDWVDDGWQYESFRKALVYDADASDSGGATTSMVAWIDCNCNERAHSRTKGGSVYVHSVHGFCSDPCRDVLLLRERAVTLGWEWHDAGIIMCPAYHIEWVWDENTGESRPECTICDWYDQYKKCMCCASDGEQWHYVACGCEGGIQDLDIVGWDGWEMAGEMLTECNEPTSAYLDVEWICDCDGQRELYIAYPEVFGVTDIVFGSEQIVQGTDQYSGNPRIATVGWLMNSNTSMEFIEYRTMACIRKKCPTGSTLIAFTPEGSGFSQRTYVINDLVNPHFLGRERITFGTDSTLTEGQERRGYIIMWTMTHCFPKEDQCYPGWTEEDANYFYELAKPHHRHYPCGVSIVNDYLFPSWECILEPDIRQHFVQGGVFEVVHEEEGPMGETFTWSEWCYHPDYWCVDGGAVIPTMEGFGNIVYNVNWLESNRGFILHGISEPYTQLDIIGIGPYALWEDDYGPVEHPGQCTDQYWVPLNDTTYYPRVLDTDMHWCIPDFDFNPDSDSYSISLSE